MMYFNANSVAGKLNFLKLLLETEKPDIVGISETKLDSRDPDTIFSEVISMGYCLFRKDRDNFGGGVALLISSILKPIRCDFATVGETVFVDCNAVNGAFRLGCCYRPPANPDAFDEIATDIYSATNNCEFPIILCGDFNMPCVDWVLGCSSVARYQNFINYLATFSYEQYVFEATRFNPES